MYKATNIQQYGLSIGAIARTAEGKYVLHRDRAGILRMITGTLEPGETPAQCIEREILEEAGLSGLVSGYAGATINIVVDDRGMWEKVTLWHYVDVTGRCPGRTDDLDCDVIEVGQDELCSALNHADRWPDDSMLTLWK